MKNKQKTGKQRTLQKSSLRNEKRERRENGVMLLFWTIGSGKFHFNYEPELDKHCSSQGCKKKRKKIKASLKVRHIYVSYNLCICRPKMSVKTGPKAHEIKSEKKLIVYTNDVRCVYTCMYTRTHTRVKTKIYSLSLDTCFP